MRTRCETAETPNETRGYAASCNVNLIRRVRSTLTNAGEPPFKPPCARVSNYGSGPARASRDSDRVRLRVPADLHLSVIHKAGAVPRQGFGYAVGTLPSCFLNMKNAIGCRLMNFLQFSAENARIFSTFCPRRSFFNGPGLPGSFWVRARDRTRLTQNNWS